MSEILRKILPNKFSNPIVLSHEQDVHAGGYKNKMAMKNETKTDIKCSHYYGDGEEEVVDQPIPVTRVSNERPLLTLPGQAEIFITAVTATMHIT